MDEKEKVSEFVLTVLAIICNHTITVVMMCIYWEFCAVFRA